MLRAWAELKTTLCGGLFNVFAECWLISRGIYHVYVPCLVNALEVSARLRTQEGSWGGCDIGETPILYDAVRPSVGDVDGGLGINTALHPPVTIAHNQFLRFFFLFVVLLGGAIKLRAGGGEVLVVG